LPEGDLLVVSDRSRAGMGCTRSLWLYSAPSWAATTLINSVLWHMRKDIPDLPNKWSITPIFFNVQNPRHQKSDDRDFYLKIEIL
jgi:hypothetical protein